MSEPEIGDPRLPERFWRRIRLDTQTGCWEWTGYLSSDGYGRYSVKGQSREAYRVAFQVLRQEPKPGMHLDHLCRNRACCNPTHLELVTPRVNVLRGETVAARNAQKTHCPQGHEYNEANTYVFVRSSGVTSRLCRTCNRAAAARYAAKRCLETSRG